ncbi:MAG: RNA methyltransferase, partial [Anaerolineae bacterium]|nr:RNA methyltransferase [Anaerolineae bacterium]
MEGVRLVQDAWRAGIFPALVFYTPQSLRPSGERLIAEMAEANVPCLATTERVLSSISDTVTPQGIVAILPMPDMTIWRPADFSLILDRVSDPGNLGAVLRVAAGAGVEQVWLAPGTVDPFN